jgi:hypothetical protein
MYPNYKYIFNRTVMLLMFPADVISINRKMLCVTLLFLSFSTLAQESKQTLGGTITATNNGISIIPSFSLEKPAIYFDISMSGERFSFDPLLQFGMNGKPWSFVFWGRYKLIKQERFTLTIGGHPAFLFLEEDLILGNVPDRQMIANRYLAGEINSNYKINRKLSMGLYYLSGSGIQTFAAKKTDFLALNTIISDIRLYRDFQIKINPQFFFLEVDGDSGFYVNSSFTLSKTDFPILLQGFFNQKLISTIQGENLLWNVSLLYTFSNNISKK